MNLLETLRIGLHGITANRLRSSLTVLGILIGVAAVIVLVAVGNGSSVAVAANIEKLGTNTLTIRHGSFGGFGPFGGGSASRTQLKDLTEADAVALADPTVNPDIYSASPVVQAASADAQGAAQAEVSSTLDARHGITSSANRDYQVLNQASLLTAVDDNTRVFTVLLGAVAAISLIVGGIGITNIMLVTVTERTREIGIRKAIGASRGAILGQFLVEATVLSMIGGVAGVIVALIVTRFSIAGVVPVIVPVSVAGAFAVSVALGLFFGSYPANRAASLRPIEALRHE